MNGFALYSGANIGLTYDCKSAQKSEKVLFYGGISSGKRKEDAHMRCGTENGKPLTDKEYQQQEVEQQEGIQNQAKALALKLARTYEELTRLLEQNPGGEAGDNGGHGQGRQGLPEAETVAEDGGHGSALPMGEAGRNELRVTADEAAHLLFCAHADGGSQGADAKAAAAGRRQRDPGWVDADTEGGD
jgi:hypothetical protein